MVDIRTPAALAAPARQRPNVNVPDMNSLTPMQGRFIEEYLIDLNPRQAAIRAGAPVKEASSRSNAWMRHTLVREAIGRAMAERSKRTGINADRILQRLGALALGDPTSIFNEHGGLKLPSEMNEHDRLLIAGVKTRRSISPGVDADGKTVMQPEEIVEVKVIDQVSVLTLAMKHLGMLNEKLDVNVTSLADRLREAQLRRAGVIVGDKIEGELNDATGSGDGSLSDDYADGSAAQRRLGSGGGRILDADWHTVTDAETASAPASEDHAAQEMAAALGYDPLAVEPAPFVIDWDPLA